MKSRKRNLPIIILIIALMLSSTACNRFSKVNKDVNEVNQKDDRKESQEENQEENQQEEPGSNYLVPVTVNDGFSMIYGYADKNGKSVIEPQFKMAEPFYECGVAIVTDQNDRDGLINTEGKYLVEPKFDYFFYSEGLFLAYDEEKNTTSAFDEQGSKKFEVSGYIYEFSDGLSPFYSETERGYMDTTGKLAIKMNYEYLGSFVNGIAEVSETYLGASFYIDTKGNDVTDKKSSDLRMFKDETNSLFGYKNKDGEVIIKAQYVEAKPFLNGYAVVNGSDETFTSLYGVINTQGEYVLQPKYCGILRMKNGLIVVGEEAASDYVPFQYFDYCKKALYTPDMKEHTDWIYYSVDDFDDKSVCVNDETSVFFINKDLKQATGLPNFKGQGYFKKDGSLLRGDFNHLFTVADQKGNILTKSNTIVNLGDEIIADRQIESPVRTYTIAYPVLSGVKDKALQDKINEVIRQDMVTPYEQIYYADEDPYQITVFDSGYMITRQKNLILIDQGIYEYSLGAAHGAHFRNTLYIDLKTGSKYELNDLFKPSGEAYSFLSEAVSTQMKAKMEEVGYWEDHVTITPDTCFALADGGIVLYFGEYEIASYAAGMQEFFIPFTDLADYIDKEGAFWKSFN